MSWPCSFRFGVWTDKFAVGTSNPGAAAFSCSDWHTCPAADIGSLPDTGGDALGNSRSFAGFFSCANSRPLCQPDSSAGRNPGAAVAADADTGSAA